MTRIIILVLKSGFSNRIFPLITTYKYCKKYNIKLVVIWSPNTCRACIKNYNKHKYYTLLNYYKIIPLDIEIISDIKDISNKYSINKFRKIDMKWTNKVPNIKTHEYILLFNVCHPLFYENYDGAETFAPYPITSVRLIDNKIIKELSNIMETFQLKDELQIIINNYEQFDIGIHIRITDGGFKKYNKEKMFANTIRLIDENFGKKIFLCTDDKVTGEYFEKSYPMVIQYKNDNKYINSDIGTYYSLVDMYLLSNCISIYGTAGSSFFLLAYTINNNNKHKEINFLEY